MCTVPLTFFEMTVKCKNESLILTINIVDTISRNLLNIIKRTLFLVYMLTDIRLNLTLFERFLQFKCKFYAIVFLLKLTSNTRNEFSDKYTIMLSESKRKSVSVFFH